MSAMFSTPCITLHSLCLQFVAVSFNGLWGSTCMPSAFHNMAMPHCCAVNSLASWRGCLLQDARP